MRVVWKGTPKNIVSDMDALTRHIYGATVVHRSPFGSIEVPTAENALSKEQWEKWVIPFYHGTCSPCETDFMVSLKGIYGEISPALVELLLTEFNWRPRVAGAFFAAVKQFDSLEDHIGRLLLRSDVCFAGKRYCVALAEFNSAKGMDYLRRYLEYYLTRPDLNFDQGEAMGAVGYLDGQNGTKYCESFRPLWDAFVKANPFTPVLKERIACFSKEMEALRQCRSQVETRN